MKAIQVIKKSLRTTKKVLRGIFGAYERDRRSAAPATAGGRDSVSEKHLFGGIAFVLRHGILSLYSHIRKFIPWRSRTYIQNLRNIRIAGLSSSFLLGLLALAIIIPLYNVSGTEDTEAATVDCVNSGDSNLGANCTMTFTATKMTATADLTMTNASGTFTTSSDSEKASFTIETNNAKGYELTIASTSDTLLTNTNDNTKSFNVITSSGISESSFGSDTWGYLPNYYDSNINTNYYPISTTTVILDKTNSSNVGNSKFYSIGIGAKATYSLPAGTYTNDSIILSYVANPTPFTINFNKNTTDTVTNMPNNTAGDVSGTSITINDSIPVRDGYNFLGWCNVATTNTNNTDSCSGTTYNETGASTWQYPIDRTSTVANTVTLYAMWEKATWGYIQDLSNSTCQSLASSSPITVLDKRDEKDYTVRYINGSCWMTQNLRFTGTSVPSATSNVTADKTLTYYSLDSSNAGSFGAYSDHCDSTNGYNYACIYDSGSTTTGVWYNYHAATAGTVSSSSNSTATSQDICPKNWHLPTGPNTTSGTEINNLVGNTTSGWQNPTTGLTAFSAVVGGSYNSGSLRETGLGYWWSATAYNTTARYNLRYNSSDGQFNGDRGGNRYSGLFVRCVHNAEYTVAIATNNATGITIDGTTYTNGQTAPLTIGVTHTIEGVYDTDYEFSSWSVSGSATLGSTSTDPTTLTINGNTTLTLTGKKKPISFQTATYADCGMDMYDDRGVEAYRKVIYTTAEINGLCWMTRNLDLPGGTTLTPDDTNLTTGFTLPRSSTSGFASYNADYVYNSSSTYNDTSCGNSDPCYSYYSFYTATAHWGTSYVTYGSSSVDICPKGWRLPTHSEMSGITSSVSSFSPVYSGHYYNSAFSNGGSNGYWWSSTAFYNANYAYHLSYYNNGSLDAGVGLDKYYGIPIRCVAKRYNVTIATTNNATGIVIDGTTYSNGDTVSLFEGDYTISGTYASGYYFDSWSVTSGGALGSTVSDPTTLTVTGNVTLTLTGTNNKLWFQNATSADCGKTMYDHRGNATYANIAYTTAEINGLCWMTRNLDLPGGTTISQSDSNLNGSTTSYTLRASSTSGFDDYSTGWVYNSGRTTCSSDKSTGSCYSYYSYVAATAGTNPSSGEASSDICPKGWRLPTKAEYDTLVSSYNTGAKLTTSPFYGVYSGRYVPSSFSDGGSYGDYWSSTAYNSVKASHLFFSSSSANTYNDGAKNYGVAIRCVAKS